MIQTINEYDFRDSFLKLRPNNFSYEGLTALYKYLEELEQNMDQPIELDTIAICCDYTEYKSLEDFQNDYPDIETIEDLMSETTVIKVSKEGFIIQNF